jgi:hypothetical protein
MANLFDRANYPTQEPDTLVIGDRWMWRRPDLASIYDPSEYLQLKLVTIILSKLLQQQQQVIQQMLTSIMFL